MVKNLDNQVGKKVFVEFFGGHKIQTTHFVPHLDWLSAKDWL